MRELIVDNFAGGGGASTGIGLAFGRSVDVAINHDPEALAMHAINHPDTLHVREDVFKVDPVALTGGRPVGLAWFSPDCTHHSKAKGGAPRSPRVRGLAWVVIRWALRVRPRVIMLENVEEFQDWGPLCSEGFPIKEKAGMTFRLWVNQLRGLGYTVDWRELRACDYGAPTSRKRLFIVARSDGEPIVWPAPTHGPGLIPHRTAAECVDWSIPCPSIFERDRPLAENTLRRIARGIKRYVIDNPRPFIVPMTHAGDARVHSLDEPLRTITTANRGELALAVPFIAGVGGRQGQSPERDVDRPYQTITTKADSVIVAPTLVQTGYGERDGQAPRSLDLHAPLGTVVACGQKHALVAAFLAKHYGGNETPGTPMDKAMDTITTQDHHALVAAHIMKMRGSNVGHGADEPLHTISANGNHFAEVRALLIKFYGTEQDPRLDEPLHTVTTKDRFGLVTVHGQEYAIVDIGMRMLQPRELFRAQGFSDDYVIDRGTRIDDGTTLTLPKHAQVRMCGNSVCPPIAEALVRANFGIERARRAA